MYNLTIFLKSYFLPILRFSENWPIVRGATKKFTQGLGGGKDQFLDT